MFRTLSHHLQNEPDRAKIAKSCDVSAGSNSFPKNSTLKLAPNAATWRVARTLVTIAFGANPRFTLWKRAATSSSAGRNIRSCLHAVWITLL
jgi:hypothetical protein